MRRRWASLDRLISARPPARPTLNAMPERAGNKRDCKSLVGNDLKFGLTGQKLVIKRPVLGRGEPMTEETDETVGDARRARAEERTKCSMPPTTPTKNLKESCP